MENGRIRPGDIIVGTDSYTCTYGALGVFSAGIGSTEMLGVLVTGKIWMRVPESIRIIMRGELPEKGMAKECGIYRGICLKYGDNINTDIISPPIYMELPIDQAAAYAMSPIDSEFATKCRPGNIFVAEENLGSSSSRETAP